MNNPAMLEVQIALECAVNRGVQIAGGDHAKNPRWLAMNDAFDLEFHAEG
jgi:hypothetical protein